MIIMIYVNCLYYLGYHIRNKQKENTGSGTFAVCKNHGTRQRNQCLPCAKAKAHGKHLNFAMCHVYRHTAKAAATSLPRFSAFFCRGSALAHGKGFAVCPINGTRQTTLCRRLNAVCSLPCAAHGKAAVSRSDGRYGHSTKNMQMETACEI